MNGKTISSFAFSCALVGLTGLIALPSFTAPVSLSGFFILILLASLGLDALAAEKLNEKSAGTNLPLVIVAGILLTWMFFRLPTWQGLHRGMVWLSCGCGGLVLRKQIHNQQRQQIALRSFLVLAAALCFRGIAEHVYLFEQLREQWQANFSNTKDQQFQNFLHSNRARATFGQANAFAGFLILALPVVVGGIIHNKKSKMAWAAFVILIMALYASGSKGGALVATIATGLTLREWKPSLSRKRLAWIILVVAGSLVAIIAYALLGGGLPATIEAKLTTLYLRVDYTMAAQAMFFEDWTVGVGLELIGENFPLYNQNPASFSRYVHNGFLQILCEFGIIGLPAFGLLFYSWKSQGLSLAHTTPKKRSRTSFEVFAVLAVASWLTFNLALTTNAIVANAFILLGPLWLLDRIGFARLAKKLVGSPRLIEKAANLSLIGFLLHSLVDFDLHVTGVVAALCLVLALPGQQKRETSFSNWPSRLICVLSFALAAWWLIGPVPLQMRRLNQSKVNLADLAEFPVDLRLLYRAAPVSSAGKSEKEAYRRLLIQHRDSFGHLPGFSARLKSLEEK